MLEEIDDGQILLDGLRRLAIRAIDADAARRAFGMVFQSYNLFKTDGSGESHAAPRVVARRDAVKPRRWAPLLDRIGLYRDKADAIRTRSRVGKQSGSRLPGAGLDPARLLMPRRDHQRGIPSVSARSSNWSVS